MRHKYSGLSGPWLENAWCEYALARRRAGGRLSDVFGPYVPLLVPWTDIWIAGDAAEVLELRWPQAI